MQTDLRDLDELHELPDDLVRLTGLVTMINIAQQGMQRLKHMSSKQTSMKPHQKSSGSIAGTSNLNGDFYMLMHTNNLLHQFRL